MRFWHLLPFCHKNEKTFETVIRGPKSDRNVPKSTETLRKMAKVAQKHRGAARLLAETVLRTVFKMRFLAGVFSCTKWAFLQCFLIISRAFWMFFVCLARFTPVSRPEVGSGAHVLLRGVPGDQPPGMDGARHPPVFFLSFWIQLAFCAFSCFFAFFGVFFFPQDFGN